MIECDITSKLIINDYQDNNGFTFCEFLISNNLQQHKTIHIFKPNHLDLLLKDLSFENIDRLSEKFEPNTFIISDNLLKQLQNSTLKISSIYTKNYGIEKKFINDISWLGDIKDKEKLQNFHIMNFSSDFKSLLDLSGKCHFIETHYEFSNCIHDYALITTERNMLYYCEPNSFKLLMKETLPYKEYKKLPNIDSVLKNHLSYFPSEQQNTYESLYHYKVKDINNYDLAWKYTQALFSNPEQEFFKIEYVDPSYIATLFLMRIEKLNTEANFDFNLILKTMLPKAHIEFEKIFLTYELEQKLEKKENKNLSISKIKI